MALTARSRTAIGVRLAVLCAALVTSAADAQNCQPFWGQGAPLVNGYTGDAIAFDDGSGPALFGLRTQSFRPYQWHEGEPQWAPILNGLPVGFDISPPFLILDDGSGPRLFACGAVQSGGPIQSYLLRWNGMSWENPWPGIMTTVCELTFVSADLGDGMAIYGATRVNGLCTVGKWTGDHWQQVGPPPNGSFQLVTFNDGAITTLYIGGGFSSIGGVPIFRFARWTGTQWVQAGDSTTISISQGVTLNDGTGPALYGIGGGTLNGQSYFNSLFRFDGQHWSLAGAGPQTGIYAVNSVDLFDDGSGPAIYIGGSFPSFGGAPARGVARYDGHAWSALGDGAHGEVLSLAHLPTSRGPSLFAFGSFTIAGAGSAIGSAQWVGCPNCYTNCDNSTLSPRLNILDFTCFLNKFAARDPYANCNVDAAIDVSDFLCFLNKFAAGCP